MIQLNTIPWTTPRAGQLVRNKRTGKYHVLDRGWDKRGKSGALALQDNYDLLLEPYESPEQGYFAMCGMFGVEGDDQLDPLHYIPEAGANIVFTSACAIWLEQDYHELPDALHIAGDGTPPELDPLKQLVDTILAWRDYGKVK